MWGRIAQPIGVAWAMIAWVGCATIEEPEGEDDADDERMLPSTGGASGGSGTVVSGSGGGLIGGPSGGNFGFGGDDQGAGGTATGGASSGGGPAAGGSSSGGSTGSGSPAECLLDWETTPAGDDCLSAGQGDWVDGCTNVLNCWQQNDCTAAQCSSSPDDTCGQNAINNYNAGKQYADSVYSKLCN